MAIITQYNGPFGGINVSAPDIIIPPTDSPYMNNIVLRQNYICSRPPFNLGILPDLPAACTGIATYLTTSNTYITLAFTATSVYTLATSALSWLGPVALPATALFNLSYIGSVGNLYYVNGSQYVLYNGNAQVATNLFGARYIFELAGSLLIADTFEPTEFPFRVRWCESGQPTNWDPNTYVGAGFTDLLDINDSITGTLSLGSVAFLLRRNGITQLTPTGNGIQPFNFNHLWAAEHGIGQYYPQACAAYGSVGFIFAFDNIYLLTINNFTPIATKVMENIITDIGGIISPTGPALYAWALPKKYNNVLYMTYEIAIPTTTGAVIWSYSVKDQNWMRHVLTGFPTITANANQITYKVNI